MRIEVYAAGARPAGDVLVVPPGLGTSAPPDAVAALRAFAEEGGRVLALGDAVGLLCATGLLPGTVETRSRGDAATHVRVEGRATPFTWAIPAGRVLALGGPAEHRYVAPESEVAALAGRGRILLRYCDSAGGVTRAGHTGDSVAGLCDDTGRIVGILGGVSHALDCAVGGQIRACLVRD